MSNYLFLQFKRVLKLFPLFLLISAVFFAGLSAVYIAFINMDNNSEKNQKFKIGIAGDPGEDYVEMGLAALQTLDSSRYALELVRIDEQTAEKMLQNGNIAAYAVFPDDFIDNALSGKITPIRFVTTSSSASLVSMFKDELATAITDIMSQSQSGSYGIYDALKENGHSDIAFDKLNDLSIKYVDLILDRSNIYTVEELGIGDGVDLAQYLFCSLTVLYICIMVLPFAHLYVKKDYSLMKLLHSHGLYCTQQVVAEYAAFSVMIIFVFSLIMVGLNFGLHTLNNFGFSITFEIPFMQVAKYSIPIILVVSAISFMIYELSGNLISGILIYLFTAIFLCYTSGCIYPSYMLPDTLQNLAKFLPFGISRAFLTGGVNYEFDILKLLSLLLFALFFTTMTVLLRRHKIVARSNK